MKKILLTLGASASAIAPIATVVACGTHTTGGYEVGKPAIVAYAPDLDMALALGIEVTSTHHMNANKSIASMIKDSGKFDAEIAKVTNENEAFWDFGDFDEEYWLGLNPSLLIGEYWVGAERRERMELIVPNSAFFDYNQGVQGETFEVQVVGDDESENKIWRIANDANTIYGDSDDYWQMQDMSAFLTQSAIALDKVEGVSGKETLAKKIISRTDARWSTIREENIGDGTLPTGKTFTSVKNEDKGSLENLLAIGMSDTDNLNPTISTPSNMKELYTKSGYNYPELTLTQSETLAAKGGNWAGMANTPAKIADKSQVDNGISFSSDDPAFYSDYNGKIDKMIISLPDAIRNESTKEELFAEIKANTIITSMFDNTGEEFDIDDIMFVSPYLAGGNTHNFKQPIGQNSLMDKIASEWLEIEEEDDFFTWW